VLGKFPDYITLADELGANRFSIPAKEWNAMTPVQQWAANRAFLDAAISRGDDIILSNPVSSISDATGYFKMELEYLAGKGYSLISDGTRMVRR